MASTSTSSPSDVDATLSLNEIANCNSDAQFQGVLFGTAAGVLAGFISARGFKMAPKVSTFSGILSGAAAGYIFSKQSLAENIARAKKEKVLQLRIDREGPGGVYNMNRGEAAPGAGLESLDDKYATTSGEH